MKGIKNGKYNRTNLFNCIQIYAYGWLKLNTDIGLPYNVHDWNKN